MRTLASGVGKEGTVARVSTQAIPSPATCRGRRWFGTVTGVGTVEGEEEEEEEDVDVDVILKMNVLGVDEDEDEETGVRMRDGEGDNAYGRRAACDNGRRLVLTIPVTVVAIAVAAEEAGMGYMLTKA